MKYSEKYFKQSLLVSISCYELWTEWVYQNVHSGFSQQTLMNMCNVLMCCYSQFLYDTEWNVIISSKFLQNGVFWKLPGHEVPSMRIWFLFFFYKITPIWFGMPNFFHLHMQHAPVTIRQYFSTVESTQYRITMQNTSKCSQKTRYIIA